MEGETDQQLEGLMDRLVNREVRAGREWTNLIAKSPFLGHVLWWTHSCWWGISSLTRWDTTRFSEGK